ncbi:uncharacterized protein LOC107361448 [Tetranychus urticae]|uniref:Uncharacterized protein n=1 Tax=Tetranychus urticae TaxID=32264 RepID=T1K7Q1_TETUR|nr:uncharacterized protein LOC107361448 [Tetranychus urticae]
MINLNNKVALITGSSDGIGAATAILFSSLGAKVSIVGRDQSKLDKVAAECESKSPHHYKPVVTKADFIRDEDVVRTFEKTISVYKTLDILVNNAAIDGTKGFGEPDAMNEYDRIMQINVRAVVRLTELAVPHLKQTKGAIVNVSSIVGLKPIPPVWSYCMSKASLDMFTKCMAGKLAPDVRVNSVNPGVTRTNFQRELTDLEAFRARAASLQPMKRLAEPIEIANTIAFLASDAASNMTGSIVVSDSGMLIADPFAQ